MAKTHTSIKNFTPVPDALVARYGLVTAAVYGRVWRYCEMKDNVCYASLDSIATGLGVNRVTIMRHLQTLVSDGYLDDLTPNVRNRPHTYKVTDALVWEVTLGVAESNTAVT